MYSWNTKKKEKVLLTLTMMYLWLCLLCNKSCIIRYCVKKEVLWQTSIRITVVNIQILSNPNLTVYYLGMKTVHSNELLFCYVVFHGYTSLQKLLNIYIFDKGLFLYLGWKITSAHLVTLFRKFCVTGSRSPGLFRNLLSKAVFTREI